MDNSECFGVPYEFGRDLKLHYQIMMSNCERSLYKIISTWSKIRKVALGNRKSCEICNSFSERLIMHECWNFDTKKKIQTLYQLQFLCYECHSCITCLDLEYIRGRVDRSNLYHFMNVNKVNYEFYIKYKKFYEKKIIMLQRMFLYDDIISWEVDKSLLYNYGYKSKIVERVIFNKPQTLLSDFISRRKRK